jgi:KDO2-lipid IV(A) lauroyltransferase
MSRLFFMLARWPLGLLHPMGAALGWITYALSPSYRRRLKAHTDQAGLSASQRWSAVAHAGRMVAELPRFWGRPAGMMLGDRVHWVHPEAVEQALAKGKGVVVLSPHMGCFEICAQAYAERFGAVQPMTALYRPAKQAWLATILVHSRNRPHLNSAPATISGVRQLLRALKSGQTLGMLPDQVPPEGMGVWAPFFGTPAYTMTMGTKLAYQTGASLVWLRGERLGFWQRHKVGADFIIHAQAPGAALDEAVRLGDPTQSAIAMNREMEAVIMQCPQQYLWGYNRYKQPKANMLTSPAAKDAG